jgi:antitoxin component YwqK of YwqJK toxin-antitoxin module
MKYKIIFITFIFIASSLFSFAQENSINQVDDKGYKQGLWKKYYQNGKLQYEGNFKNNKPVGELKRYTNDGVLKAVLDFEENSNNIYAKFYHPGKKIQAEGIYIGQSKDSIWNYYSEDGFLINKVPYVNDIKTGIEEKFYNNGNLYEKTEWKEGIKDGLVLKYYDSGNVMLRIFYMNGIFDGEYNVYGPDENILIQGQYENNKREGTWKYYKENGHIETELKYINGVAENQEELERLENEYIEKLENDKGKFKEPTEEDIFK